MIIPGRLSKSKTFKQAWDMKRNVAYNILFSFDKQANPASRGQLPRLTLEGTRGSAAFLGLRLLLAHMVGLRSPLGVLSSGLGSTSGS